MMGRQTADQARLFYEFHLDERVPADHLLRRVDVFASAALGDLRQTLADHYSHTGRPSIASSTCPASVPIWRLFTAQSAGPPLTPSC